MAKTKPDPHVWGETKVAPGTSVDVQVPVSEDHNGHAVNMPIHIRRAAIDGPVVFLTGAVHGDELNGTATIRRIIIDPPFVLSRGTLILVPVVNVPGFNRQSRYMPDRRDLNRCFPGSVSGSMASRVARAAFHAIVKRSNYGIDLHTAAVRRTNFPNVRADMDSPATAAFAHAFGAELLLSGKGPTGSLRRAACKAGCPTIVLEAGEVWRSDPAIVEYATRGIRNCLIDLEMVEGTPSTPPYRVATDATNWVRAKKGGLLSYHVAPGDVVERGTVLATGGTVTGQSVWQVTAPRDGVVLGMSTIPTVQPGDPVVHLAYPRRGAIPRIEKAVERLDQDSLHRRLLGQFTAGLVEPEPMHDS